MVGPVVEEIAQERPDVKVGKIDVDEQRELSAAFQIMSIPTLVVMQDGKVTQQVVGLRPKAVSYTHLFYNSGMTPLDLQGRNLVLDGESYGV